MEALLITLLIILALGLIALGISYNKLRSQYSDLNISHAKLEVQSQKSILLEEQLNSAQTQIDQLRENLSRHRAIIEAKEERMRELREEHQTRDNEAREQFKNLASEILEEQSTKFKSTNKESLNILLKPFKDNITEFRQRMEHIYSNETEQRGSLRNELKNLMDLNRQITTETTNLTNALKGNSKVQGDWGEMILETILDSSNLIKGVHYKTQFNVKDEEGNNLRPDVVLCLPENKQIVIDSKVSLTAFVGYMEAEDEVQRKSYMASHIASVRQHVMELGRKEYQKLLNSPDFVIMFIPNEPAFLAALQTDSSIWSDAYDKRVIISSPTNLFALLKLVDDLWKRNDQSRNTADIVTYGTKLYDQLVNFTSALEGIGQ
ncbi:MAG: DNA recombination protein RmuC, partial [Rikenellaceae bacterium]